MRHPTRSTFLRHVGAVFAILLAALAHLALLPILGPQFPLITYIAAVVLVAWLFGPGPAALALVSGGVVGLTLFSTYEGSESISGAAILARSTIYVLVGVAAIQVSGAHRAVRRRLDREAQERQKAEQHLALQARVLEGMAEGVCISDERGTIVYTNPAEDRIFGYKPGELIGMNVADRDGSQAGEHARTIPEVGDLLNSEGSWSGEWRNRRKDGTHFWTSARISTIERGDERFLVCMQEDITERKEAEEALRASEERFRHLAEAVPHLVWITRPDRSVEYVNRRWLDYTGQTPEQALSPEGWREAVHPDDLGRVVEASVRSHVTGQPLMVEYRIRDASGEYRWHIGRAVPVFDESGRILRRFGTATDIDGRKREEQGNRFLADAGASLAALVNEEETLQEVARLAVPDFAEGCLVDLIDEAGTFRRVAVSHVDPAKVERAIELHRRNPPRLETTRSIPRIVPEIRGAMLVLDARDQDHLDILRGLRPRSSLCVPLQGRGGTLGMISFVIAESDRQFDADDLRLAEDLAHRAAIAIENARLYDRLLEADRRKDEFLATLAHELRNPLAPIRTALYLMKRPDGSDDEFEEERAMAERQVVHLARLIDDLMDVARISKGKLALHTQVVDLRTVVRQAVQTAQAQIDARSHHLTVSLPEGPVCLEADPTRLEQIFCNLLNNAAKYTEPGGQLSLVAERDGSEVVVRVRDSGIGIDPAMIPRLFQMFFQLGEHREYALGGLGIGLGLVRRLVELHGGTIEAWSEGPGTGSEFVLRLPLIAASPEAGPPEPSRTGRGEPRAGAASSRRRILVVDDNVDAANVLGVMLARLHGQDVRVAHDGPEGLEVAEAFRPEVVLLDIGLPGMSGHEVARQIRSRPWGAEPSLIALTGWGQESDRQHSEEAGFDLHLVKPVNAKDLIEAIRSLEPGPVPADGSPSRRPDPNRPRSR